MVRLVLLILSASCFFSGGLPLMVLGAVFFLIAIQPGL